MSDDKKYNGWANWETWKVNLELFDGYEWDHAPEAEEVEETAREHIFSDGKVSNFVDGIVESFLSEVDWEELAEAYGEEFEEEFDIEQYADHFQRVHGFTSAPRPEEFRTAAERSASNNDCGTCQEIVDAMDKATGQSNG
jgi:hypothetical protein